MATDWQVLHQEVLSEETLGVLNPNGIEFLKYDMRIKDYVIIVCNEEQETAESLGYERLSDEEMKDNFLDIIYPKRSLYKIPKTVLFKRHSLC